jgi:hypothetical protein
MSDLLYIQVYMMNKSFMGAVAYCFSFMYFLQCRKVFVQSNQRELDGTSEH